MIKMHMFIITRVGIPSTSAVPLSSLPRILLRSLFIASISDWFALAPPPDFA